MFQIFCCTAKIHQFEDPQPDHPPEKKSICKLFYILLYICLFFEYNSKYYLVIYNIYKIVIQFFSRSYRATIKCL